MFNNGPVVDTYFEVECTDGRWEAVSYVVRASGRKYRNSCGGDGTQEDAYRIVNILRKGHKK